MYRENVGTRKQHCLLLCVDRSNFNYYVMWVLGTKLRLSDLAASTFPLLAEPSHWPDEYLTRPAFTFIVVVSFLILQKTI